MRPVTDLLGDVVADVNLLVVQKHTVDSLDSGIGGLGGLVVNEAVALGAALLIGCDLARKDIAESSEGVVKSLVVNSLVQVLDEDVALAGLAESGVTLGPHDAAANGFSLRHLIHCHVNLLTRHGP